MELDVAVVADGDDAAGALAVVLTERDVLMEELLQLIAPGGEPIRFGFEHFGTIVRFDAHQLVLPPVEELPLARALRRTVTRWGIEPGELHRDTVVGLVRWMGP